MHSSATGIIGSEGTALRTTLESEELKYRKGYRKNRNTSSGEAPVICSSTITTSEIATPMAAEAKSVLYGSLCITKKPMTKNKTTASPLNRLANRSM